MNVTDELEAYHSSCSAQCSYCGSIHRTMLNIRLRLKRRFTGSCWNIISWLKNAAYPPDYKTPLHVTSTQTIVFIVPAGFSINLRNLMWLAGQKDLESFLSYCNICLTYFISINPWASTCTKYSSEKVMVFVPYLF